MPHALKSIKAITKLVFKNLCTSHSIYTNTPASQFYQVNPDSVPEYLSTMVLERFLTRLNMGITAFEESKYQLSFDMLKTPEFRMLKDSLTIEQVTEAIDAAFDQAKIKFPVAVLEIPGGSVKEHHKHVARELRRKGMNPDGSPRGRGRGSAHDHPIGAFSD